MNDNTDTEAEAEASQADAAQAEAIDQMLSSQGEAHVRAQLTATGNRAGLQLLDRILARRLATELLEQGQPQPVVRERLITDRGLSRRTAYRVIELAAAQLGMRTTTNTDPQPERPTMTSTTEAAQDSTAVAQHQADQQQPAEAAPGAGQEQKAPALRVRIAYLHAPWPQGAKVGHVVEFPGLEAIPAWAAGKCAAVPSSTPADFVHQPPKPEAPAAAAPVWDRLTLTASTSEGRAAELAKLRADLGAAEAAETDLAQKLADARARQQSASQRLVSATPPGFPLGVVTGAAIAESEHDKAARQAGQLEASHRNAKARADALRAEVEQLALQVSAPDRLGPAIEARNVAAQQVRDTATETARMVSAIKRLDAELEAEEAAQAGARRAAAAQLIERARSGQSLDDVATPNEGRLSALREARAGAVEAHREAERVADAARAELARAERQVFAVLADQQLAEFQAAYARMLNGVGEWAAHHLRATKQMPALPNFVGDVQRAIDRAVTRIEASTAGTTA
jgi:hypothetical protein